MGRIARDSGGGDFQDAPIGTHVARCIRLYGIGTHTSEYQGKENTREQLIVGWELPSESMDDGQPFIVHKFYTLSLGEKANLRADLEAWRTKPFTPEELHGFDLENVLGKCCLVSVIPKASGKGVRVGGLMSLPKGTTLPPAHNKVWSYWLEEHTDEKFSQVPKGFQKMILESHERTGNGGAPGKMRQPGDDEIESDIPF